jgi:hypothetical protein
MKSSVTESLELQAAARIPDAIEEIQQPAWTTSNPCFYAALCRMNKNCARERFEKWAVQLWMGGDEGLPPFEHSSHWLFGYSYAMAYAMADADMDDIADDAMFLSDIAEALSIAAEL